MYPSPDLEAGKSEDFFEEIKLLELAEVITKNLSLENNPGFFQNMQKNGVTQIFSFSSRDLSHKNSSFFSIRKH